MSGNPITFASLNEHARGDTAPGQTFHYGRHSSNGIASWNRTQAKPGRWHVTLFVCGLGASFEAVTDDFGTLQAVLP